MQSSRTDGKGQTGENGWEEITRTWGTKGNEMQEKWDQGSRQKRYGDNILDMRKIPGGKGKLEEHREREEEEKKPQQKRCSGKTWSRNQRKIWE